MKKSVIIILFMLLVLTVSSNTPIYDFSGQYSGTGQQDEYTGTIKNTRYIDTPTLHMKKYGCCSSCRSLCVAISGVIGGVTCMDGVYEKWAVESDMRIGSHDVKIDYNCNYLVELYEALIPPFSISGDRTYPSFSYADTFIVEFPKKAVYNITLGLESGTYGIEINYEKIFVKEPKSIEREMDAGKQTIILTPSSNTKWSLTISEPMTCTETCPTGQLQRSAPNCTCYIPTCEPPCPAGKLQKPYPECTCYTQSEEPQKPPSGNASAGGTCQTSCPTNYTQKPYPDCSCEQVLQCTQDADCVNKGLGDKCINNNCIYSQKGGVPCLGSLFFILFGALLVIYSKQKT